MNHLGCEAFVRCTAVPEVRLIMTRNKDIERNEAVMSRPKRVYEFLLILVILLHTIVPVFGAEWEILNTCGDNLTWTKDSETLRISGNGNMYDYNFRISAKIGVSPWGFDTAFHEIIIDQGVTGIGSYAFYRCINTTRVELPASLTFIGNDAFHSCSSLTDVYYAGTEESWNSIIISGGNDELLNAVIHYNGGDGLESDQNGDAGLSTAESPDTDNASDNNGSSYVQADPQTGEGLSPYEDVLTRPSDYRIDMTSSDGMVFSTAYAAYLDVVMKCIEQYGNTELVDGFNPGQQHFTGMSFLELVDFNHDGVEELLLSFWVEGAGYVYNVWGYNGEKAVLLQDGSGFYGTNGSVQTVYLVNNATGTCLLRGSSDSFEYYYYYGWSGQQFGLLKQLSSEEDSRIGCMIDGQNVSPEQLEEARNAWGSVSTAVERYCLCPYDANEGTRTWDVINSTIQKLQDMA